MTVHHALRLPGGPGRVEDVGGVSGPSASPGTSVESRGRAPRRSRSWTFAGQRLRQRVVPSASSGRAVPGIPRAAPPGVPRERTGRTARGSCLLSAGRFRRPPPRRPSPSGSRSARGVHRDDRGSPGRCGWHSDSAPRNSAGTSRRGPRVDPDTGARSVRSAPRSTARWLRAGTVRTRRSDGSIGREALAGEEEGARASQWAWGYTTGPFGGRAPDTTDLPKIPGPTPRAPTLTNSPARLTAAAGAGAGSPVQSRR